MRQTWTAKDGPRGLDDRWLLDHRAVRPRAVKLACWPLLCRWPRDADVPDLADLAGQRQGRHVRRRHPFDRSERRPQRLDHSRRQDRRRPQGPGDDPDLGVNSTVSAKVGWLGDEPLTRTMLDRLGSRQGTMPPQPLAEDASAEQPPPRNHPILSREAIPDAVMLRDSLENGTRPSPF